MKVTFRIVRHPAVVDIFVSLVMSSGVALGVVKRVGGRPGRVLEPNGPFSLHFRKGLEQVFETRFFRHPLRTDLKVKGGSALTHKMCHKMITIAGCRTELKVTFNSVRHPAVVDIFVSPLKK